MSKFNELYRTAFDSELKIWSGPAIIPYYDRNCSFGHIAFEELRRRSSHICQISDTENTRLTNEEVRLQAIRIARQFEKLGIKQSDIIGICGRNTTYLLGVILACFFHGSAYHAINPLFDKNTSKLLFEITKPKIIFCDGSELEKIRYASSELSTKIYTLKNHFKGVPTVLDLLKPTGDENLYLPAELQKGTSQNMAILCSSGSTGTPKAVTISHTHRIWELSNYLTSDDIQLLISTLDWISALVVIVNNIVYGTTTVIFDRPCTPEYFLELVEKHKITATFNSSPLTAAIVKCTETTREKLKSIRYFNYGGSKASVTTQQALQSLLPNGYGIVLYGFTEFNKLLSRNFNVSDKPESSGVLLPGTKVRIINENGQNLGPNEIGEILCYHGGYWAGYYNNLEATQVMYDKDHWFHTGDLGYFDKDGYLCITDRKKNMLKYKGIMYYPAEIEGVVSQMPAVKEVCVFGIEDDLCGDMAAAAVVKMEGSTLTAKDVIEYVRQNIEVDYKQLYGGCKLFTEILKTPNGKVDRKATREAFLRK